MKPPGTLRCIVALMRIVPVAMMLGLLGSGASPSLPHPLTDSRPVLAAGRAQAVERTETSRTIRTYCAGCHNGVVRSSSGALLDVFDPSRIAAEPEVWSRAYRQLQAGTMPPAGAPRPDRSTSDAVLASIEQGLGANAVLPAEAASREIANRLARLLWNSAPDASLLQDVQRNRLTNAAAGERQVARMLEDDRARAFVARFFFPWLGLDRLASADPDATHFPEYDVSLRDAMTTETEMFLLSQLRADRDPVELWSANYTFLNQQLADHYGIPGVEGPQFRRVALVGTERAGLLGHGSVLMATSRHQRGPDAAYTSPATRAIWIRTRVLGAPAPRPFPGAEPLRPELPITPQTRTLPAEPCANCHSNFFPLGYALENFDPIGRWRTHDQAGAVDASGTSVDGTRMHGVADLRRVLLQRPDALRTTATERLVAYVSGRPVNAAQTTSESLIRARQALGAATSMRWSSIIAAVVRTTPASGR